MSTEKTNTPKPTSGPWQFIYGSVYTADPRYTDEEQIRIALMDRETDETSPCERDANARLIAAAPELLEACKLVFPLLEQAAKSYRSEWPDTWEESSEWQAALRIKQLITKAEGKEEQP